MVETRVGIARPGQPSPGYHYNLTDWLGTKRMQTTAAGNSQETCTSNPYGDGLSCTGGADATEQHFTGKDHDTESGLDYFYARYYSETLGRFMTPDWTAAPAAVPYASYGDPQSLNLYAYVQNDPLTGIDATGHYSNSDPMADFEEGEQEAEAQQEDLDDLGAAASAQRGVSEEEQEAACLGPCGPALPDAPGDYRKTTHGGFWHRLGEHFSNLFHGHSWSYGMRFVVTSRILPAEPNPAVTAAADLAGVGAAISRNTPPGIASAVTSSVNDPSVPNVTLNAESVLIPMAIEGSDLPIAFGFAAYDGSKFAARTITQVFTPERLQSDTIDDGLGHTLQAPQAAFDTDGGLSY
jgi:RHS repeat-associated protein